MRRLAVTAVLAVALGGCSALPQPPGPLPTPHITVEPGAAPVDYVSDDGFTRAERTALRVRTETCDGYGSGSAWVLSETTAVTNMHVIDGAIGVEVTSYDGKNYRVSEVEYSMVADLALLTIDGVFPESAVIADSAPLVGDAVAVAGFPEGVQLTRMEGAMGSTLPDTLELNEEPVFAVTVSSKEGSSGSAIVNEYEEVVGVLFSGDKWGFSFAVSLEALHLFLNDSSTRTALATTCDWM